MGMEKSSWDALVRSLKGHQCSAFLGAGAAYPHLPLAKDVAAIWANDPDTPYPFKDRSNLASVALYRSVVTDDPLGVKQEFADIITARQAQAPPDFDSPTDVHGLLAEMEMTVYLTTNYDDTLLRALEHKGKKPRHACCKWSEFLSQPDLYQSCFDKDPEYEPSVNEPLVYYFHGMLDKPQSMVLTEDDYTEFLVSLRRGNILEPPVLNVLTLHSLLFIGYSLRDWNLRVVFDTLTRKIGLQNRRKGVTVQIDPDSIKDAMLPQAKAYLEKRMSKDFRLAVYWGSADAFVADMRKHMNAGPPSATMQSIMRDVASPQP